MADIDDSSDNDTVADSDEDENEWQKMQVSAADIDSDAVSVVPSHPFSLSDGPLEFFMRFFDDALWDLLVEQTNLYAALLARTAVC